MIVLDTNVLSEALRPSPAPQVLDWMERQPRTSLFTTSVTRGEILYGLYLLPDGQRRQQMLEVIRAILDQDLAGLVWSFDRDAADAYARIAVARRQAGRPISQFDAMIAAIAQSRGASIATRNVKDFWETGVTLIDPWET
ncbi:type II toxin-antitoxin system VapC family toxin [Halochromatium salexigens]|uniref:Ribonuclease VapC n=1 Tax=Halochromatium salexigens TaxID=49447 RepID=A0AAJ0XFI0_HALSE|nr:type II toxin-antitoxin system VapC family toxin [Halochromatium salexigens]MBK5931004.1 VapC toxin family PIN domain ribonuclease [Halochromatium salexigens]